MKYGTTDMAEVQLQLLLDTWRNLIPIIDEDEGVIAYAFGINNADRICVAMNNESAAKD